MENSKYYTPSLNEFHTGFEYEVYVPEKEIWSKEVFFLNTSHINVIKYVDIQDENTLERARVKYLDKEDIEKLGFKDTLLKHDTTAIFKSDYKTSRGQEIGLLYTYNSNWCLIFAGDFGRTEWEEGKNTYQVNGNLFAGFVKNKSELKKILKMLNIK